MKYLLWLLKAAIFFTLFAFALNNQQEGSIHLWFGTVWRAPMVLIVLTIFVLGAGVGVLGMLPRKRPKPPAPSTASEDSAHGI
jgi:uncharacterized integral membrane protein